MQTVLALPIALITLWVTIVGLKTALDYPIFRMFTRKHKRSTAIAEIERQIMASLHISDRGLLSVIYFANMWGTFLGGMLAIYAYGITWWIMEQTNIQKPIGDIAASTVGLLTLWATTTLIGCMVLSGGRTQGKEKYFVASAVANAVSLGTIMAIAYLVKNTAIYMVAAGTGILTTAIVVGKEIRSRTIVHNH